MKNTLLILLIVSLILAEGFWILWYYEYPFQRFKDYIDAFIILLFIVTAYFGFQYMIAWQQIFKRASVLSYNHKKMVKKGEKGLESEAYKKYLKDKQESIKDSTSPFPFQQDRYLYRNYNKKKITFSMSFSQLQLFDRNCLLNILKADKNINIYQEGNKQSYDIGKINNSRDSNSIIHKRCIILITQNIKEQFQFIISDIHILETKFSLTHLLIISKIFNPK